MDISPEKEWTTEPHYKPISTTYSRRLSGFQTFDIANSSMRRLSFCKTSSQ